MYIDRQSRQRKIVHFYSARCLFPVADHDFHVHLVYVYHVVKSVTFYTVTGASR
jgi:hypothetical protein